MSNPCSPNASVPIAGLGSVLIFDAARLANFILQQGMGWLSPFVPQIGPVSYDLPTFCAADPPPAPETNLTTILGYFSPLNPTGGADLTNWLTTVINYRVWYASCTCSSGPAPTTPSPISAPDGLVLNPPGLSNPTTSQPCYEETVTSALGGGSGFNTSNTAARAVGGVTGITGVNFTSTNRIATGSGLNYTMTGQFINGSSSVIGSVGPITITPGNTGSVFGNLPTGAVQVRSVFTGAAGAGSSFVTPIVYDFYCGSQTPTSPQTPCCPPDPVGTAILQDIQLTVRLLQRYLLPFATVPGATHSSLSGSGSFSVSRLLGVKLGNMTIPTQLGRELGNPDYYFDLGWLAIDTPDGFAEEVRVHADGQVWYPRAMQDAVTFRYFFHPGVSADVTELEAET